MSRNLESSPEERSDLSDEMREFIELFRTNPQQPVQCIFQDDPAIIVRDMNQGCVALPAVRVQALCSQHDVSRTPMDSDVPIIDLSIDAAWSQHRGITPLYFINEAGELISSSNP